MAETQPLTRHIGPWATREARIAKLKEYFAMFLVEDAQDGTPFDCAVLDALDRVVREYPEPIYSPVGPVSEVALDPELEEEELDEERGFGDELPW